MATTRRDFLRGLLASTAVAPVLPVIAKQVVGLVPFFDNSPDWRYVVRICNIDTSPAEPPDIFAMLAKSIDRMPHYRPCDVIDVPLGPSGPQSLWRISWNEIDDRLAPDCEA
jgi:hypothetical protein